MMFIEFLPSVYILVFVTGVGCCYIIFLQAVFNSYCF